MKATRLFSKAVICVSPLDEGEDARAFLQGLVTNDVVGQSVVWAGLLSPQGKTLFDFTVWPSGPDVLIHCEAAVADHLVKRLSLYRLRRKIAITREDDLAVHWEPAQQGNDPRLAELGRFWSAKVQPDDQSADAAWLAHRLSLGVCEGQAELGDLLWLECNAAELNGVSFTKGCYVGQENTARMNWRQKVGRRLVVVPLDQSDPARQRAAYPELGLAVDHRRVEQIDPQTVPAWLKAALV